MDLALRTTLWHQFGASIDMLENAIAACPETLWSTDSKFWYIAYHTLFYLDYYVSEEPEQFVPPSPFTLSEFDPAGAMPDRVYSRDELLSYLAMGRQKCHDRIAGLTSERSAKRFVNPYKNYSVIEILLYNMRHVQHHTAQLNLLLRQATDSAPDWVSRTKIEL